MDQIAKFVLFYRTQSSKLLLFKKLKKAPSRDQTSEANRK